MTLSISECVKKRVNDSRNPSLVSFLPIKVEKVFSLFYKSIDSIYFCPGNPSAKSLMGDRKCKKLAMSDFVSWWVSKKELIDSRNPSLVSFLPIKVKQVFSLFYKSIDSIYFFPGNPSAKSQMSDRKCKKMAISDFVSWWVCKKESMTAVIPHWLPFYPSQWKNCFHKLP